MTARTDGYAPLEDYAAIGDGRTVALVARDGRIDWLPLPALHTRPVFAALVDEAEGGRIELAPEEPFEVTRSYVDGSNVLRTVFTTASGQAELTDALITGTAGRLPWAQLDRRVVGLSGVVRMRWRVVPGNAFGEDGDRRILRVGTVHGPLLRIGTVDLVLTGIDHGRTDPDGPGDGFPDGPYEFAGAFTTSAGSTHLLALGATDDEPIHPADLSRVERGIDRTVRTFQAWAEEYRYDGPYADQVKRSALALKLLIFSPTGAIAAAATNGLPESWGGGKNWDYRYAWVRDLAYTVSALVQFGLREETHAAVSWVLKNLKRYGNRQHIFFELDGALPGEPRETRATGWRGIGPVVDGNPARDQLQLGVYADVVGVMRQYVDAGNILDENTSYLIVDFVDQVVKRWRDKDAGMWELPEQQHYTSSKMACWQALNDAIALYEIGELKPTERQVRHWRRSREQVARWLHRHGWSKRLRAYEMYPGSGRLDSSALLHVGQDFDDPSRMRATVERMRERLAAPEAPELLYRYSDAEQEEGTFTAVSFWLVGALAKLGDVEDAERRMTALLDRANDVGLYSEMIDAESGAFLGNLPQGLSHLALLSAAFAIRDARAAPPLVE